MNLTQIAFHFRKPVFLVLAILLVYGVISYVVMPSREDPEIKVREALVITKYPGLNPERVEDLITKKLETAIRKIPEVKEIRSTSTTGQSIIHVEIQFGFPDLNAIWQDLRNKVLEAQAELPTGTQPSRVNDEFGDVAAITLALTSSGFDMAQMHDLAKHVRDVLYAVHGTKKIDILGVQEERIFLEISNAKAAQLGMLPTELISILQTQNIIQPGGIVDTGNKSFIIEPSGNFETLEDIGKTLITIPDTQDVILFSEIATIKRDYIDPPDQTSYFNGEPAIILPISMLSGYNILDYAPKMLHAIEQVEQTLPVGVKLNIATFQAEQVKKTVQGVSINVLQTLAIVLVVVILFLGIRTGLIVGTIVPFVMLVSLSIMNMAGIELERMSLATLIISLGLLVDNGIVIAEDFKRRLEEGIDRETALKTCGGELAIPLLISSFTTILVFIPLMLAQHAAGEYTRSLSLVILIALLTSWILALCITPTLCYYFLKIKPAPKKIKPGIMDTVYETYRAFLKIILRHRILFTLSMLCLLIVSGVLMRFVPQQFFPDSDRTQVLVKIELPAGTSSRTTDARMQDIFDILHDKEQFAHIKSFSGYVGYGGPRFVLSLSPEDPSENKGFIVINVGDADHMKPTINALRKAFYNDFPDMQARVSRMFLGPTDSSKLEIQVKGPDADILWAKAEEIKTVLRSFPDMIDIRTNWENRITTVAVEIDQQRARRAGITSSDIADTMQAYFDGIRITQFREGDTIIPIIFRADVKERFNLDRMRSMNVYSRSRGTNVPLFQIANFKPVNQYSRIERENMFRTITIEGKHLKMTAENIKKNIDPKIQEIAADLPLNHWIEYDGVISDSIEAQKALSANIPMAIGIIILLLVIQFNSFRRPLIIILTIPLILIGAVAGLLMTGSFFGFMVTLGLYSLAGIIINNAIVLIDRIDIEKAAGKDPYDAIITACIMRLRPITMTTITTILGLLPLILTKDPLFYGMSNVMAFGLGVGTILTLGVVPVLYALFFKVENPHPKTS